ncbi:hypothetical protein V501_07714 [Pseudogymnoascus sp. VKM F-4519 (FW-2642)]|nr:hypothetical protein V501_07714 [Pseudogymnoascus sp. VKM F-4519 (FW-2642)]
MAGGIKKPVNIFRLKDLGEPKEIFNWRLWLAVFSFGLMGAARGVDEGLIGGAFNSKNFQNSINYQSYSVHEQTNIKANVSAMVQIGSVGGALFAFLVCDRIGRLWATRQLCIIWIVGIAIFMGNGGNLGAVYAGRFIAGLGVGQTVVVAPVYLAEIAPASIRGLCTCVFTGFVYLGIVIAYFANYGASVNIGEHTHARWELPTSLHIMFAGIVFLLSFTQYESPRYLVKIGKDEEAIINMSRVRNLPRDNAYVLQEINNIRFQLQEEQEATLGQGWLGVLKEMFLVPSNLYRIYLGLMAQILSQWSGAGSITLYAPSLFALIGVTGTNEGLLVTAVFGIVKLVGAIICALFLVDVIGRKRSLLIGISLQAISMIYIASFLTAVPQLGTVSTFKLAPSQTPVSKGAIFMIFLSGFGWALGWNSMQYVLTAELFPLRIRAMSTSLVMCFHFANQYGSSRALPNMLLPKHLGGIDPAGTFWFFAVITIAGFVWVVVTVPETAGRDLESMDRLFSLPWYKIGMYGNRNAEEIDLAIDEKMMAVNQQEGQARQVETIRDV